MNWLLVLNNLFGFENVRVFQEISAEIGENLFKIMHFSEHSREIARNFIKMSIDMTKWHDENVLKNDVENRFRNSKTFWRIFAEILRSERCRSMFFSPKRRINVNLVDLVKSFPNSNEYSFAKVGADTAEKGPLRIWTWFNFFVQSPPEVLRDLDGFARVQAATQ